jgi:hypothetical protein
MRLAFVGLAILSAIGAVPARANITYSCAGSVDAAQAGTCNYLNTVIASQYSAAFGNANASIFIEMAGIAGAQSTTGFYNSISYSTYVADLTANALASGNAIQADALSALSSLDASVYGSDQVVITSALGEALGVPDSSLLGTTSSLTACMIGTPGCYNGIIAVANSPFLYYDQNGGTQPSGDYAFYDLVEHETDEVLGTESCISTTDASGNLTDPCDTFTGNTGTPSAVDLYRYDSAGNLSVNSTCVGLTFCSGAYFSYNGGASNGAGTSLYNTAANGYDYADYAGFNCPGGPIVVQNSSACPGTNPQINNDGGGEINILNAIGYNLQSTPEPATVALMGAGLAILLGVRHRVSRKVRTPRAD